MASRTPTSSNRSKYPIETSETLDNGFIGKAKQEVKSQIVDDVGTDFISQLLGWDTPESNKSSKKSHGVMKMGEMIDLKMIRSQARYDSVSETKSVRKTEKSMHIEAGFNYRAEVTQGGEQLTRHEVSKLERQIQEITNELRRLIGSSKMLQMEFADISIGDVPPSPGKYHLRFFEWLLIVIRGIRMKAEDAGSWINVMKSKKGQKTYKAQAKKLGTSFTLNNERTAATQTG